MRCSDQRCGKDQNDNHAQPIDAEDPIETLFTGRKGQGENPEQDDRQQEKLGFAAQNAKGQRKNHPAVGGAVVSHPSFMEGP